MAKVKVKLESDYKRAMVQSIKDAGGYGRRIEDQFAVGIFDLMLAMPGTEMVNVEVKRFTGSHFDLSPRQCIEMHRIAKGGGRPIAIGVLVTTGRFLAHGLTKDERDVRILARNCVAQNEGEEFPEFFKRVIGEKYGRPVSENAGSDPVGDSGAGGDEREGEPARRSGGQLRPDRQTVDQLLGFDDSSSQ